MLFRQHDWIFVGLVLLASIGLRSDLPAAENRSPNILILYADDLGFGDLASQNPQSKIPTPNLDRLATQGMRFSDAHSSSGICTPSRYALLTGRHHWRDFHGIVQAMGDSVFAPERLTLPEMLKECGYQTAAIGKWHLGWDWAAIRKPDAKPIANQKRKVYGPDAYNWNEPIPNGPLAHGFDSYFGDTVINFPPYCWIENDRVAQIPDRMLDTSRFKKIKEGNWECRPGPMAADWDPYQNIPTTTARGVQFIESRTAGDKPFFLYFAFPSPHAPIIPNDRFDGKSNAGPYGDFVFETDDACGQLLNALEKSGLADNTIVIFSADNGPEKYAYARDAKYDHWSAAPFRGLKRDIYEGGHHVPMIVRWPGVTQPGSTCENLVSQVDIMATLAGVVGFQLPSDAAEDSHDLRPLLNGENKTVRSSHVHNTNADQYAFRKENWLLIDSRSGYISGRNIDWEKKHGYQPDDKGPTELYDLSTDIGQRKNVASNHPDRVISMQKELQQIRDQGYSAPRLSK
ncbi:Arylsulfatase [Roseimaritima multifibrata]|uniref:Arylsulfatase n=1 Tax=Roseimaritima multifibrata TaxID=1930274 RepID=A0A517MJE6_9BACT|nr:arylsulfatase [Roseimaritima multifibrata]QDS94988.1 Arylsulfatase [Roseimaritima multifibrata]